MTAAIADDDIFHVLVSDDDMKRMNVDQLADAFRLSVIDASTLVWQTGMNGWRRLGSIADVEPEEEELETAVLWAAPPPPPPVPAPTRSATTTFRGTATYQPPVYQPPVYQPPVYQPPVYEPPVTYQASAPYDTPASYFEQAARQPAPRYEPEATYQVPAAPWAEPELVAPVYSPALPQPDPYVLPKRHADIPENIDFRRAPGSIRWGRWLVATLLLSFGVVGAYRQNLLRSGARSIGIESSYLAAERRATAFVSAQASPSVKNVLTRLALLPGPNANSDAAPEPASLASQPSTPAAPVLLAVAPAVAAPPCAAQPAEPQRATADKPASEAAVKTVSLSSLPVLGGASRAKAAEPSEPSEPSPPARSVASKREVEEEAAPRPRKKVREEASSEASMLAESKAKAKAKARALEDDPDEDAPRAKKKKKAKAEAALPPPPTDGNPLKAAMWSAVASDTKKLAARKQRD